MTGAAKINARTFRGELGGGREQYHALRDGELQALLWAATSEHQRRHGDRRTLDLLTFLAHQLAEMAREDR